MTKRFNVDDKITWQEQTFRVMKLLPNSRVNLVNLETGELTTIDLITLVQAVASGEATLPNKVVSSVLERAIDWSDVPVNARQVAEYRLVVIQSLLGLSGAALRRAIDARIEELATGDQSSVGLYTSRSRSSIYRWLKRYRQSGEDPRSLVPDTAKRGNRNQHRIHPEVLRIATSTVENYRYLGGPIRTTKHLHREIAVRIQEENASRSATDRLDAPSISSVQRLIKQADTDGRVIASRRSKKQLPNLALHNNLKDTDRPLERVEIDHTVLDVIVVDERHGFPLGRPTLTYMLDVATRYPLGMYIGFEPPSVASVMQCLRHAILPKPPNAELGTKNQWLAFGIPYELVIDNGKEFVGRDLEDACLLLGTTLVRSPVKTPQFKASVERLFRTTNTGIAHALPGTTLSNPIERGDYDSIEQASLTLDELCRILCIFLVDMYAQDLHTGLKAKPAEVWEAHQCNGFFPLTRSAEELRWMLGRVAHRTIQHYAIEFENLSYNSADLAPLYARYQHDKGRKFKIKYDPSDLGEIAVLHPDEQRYVFIPAVQHQYAKGTSLWVHRKTVEHQRLEWGQVDPAELGQAQREIQAIVDRSKSRKSTRKKEARWREGGGASASDATWDTEREAEEAAEALEHKRPAFEVEGSYEVDMDEYKRQGAGLAPSPASDL